MRIICDADYVNNMFIIYYTQIETYEPNINLIKNNFHYEIILIRNIFLSFDTQLLTVKL